VEHPDSLQITPLWQFARILVQRQGMRPVGEECVADRVSGIAMQRIHAAIP
jgi:hypothetical protein